MSILSELLQSLTGTSSNEKETVTDRPCANCPSDCAIAGEACSVCEPYKKKLIDAVYYVNNIEEYYAKYEVTGVGESAAETVTCPFCGGQSANLRVCEYCGSRLSDTAETGKIRVANASDIPNPIMQAQDIIYERADAVIAKYSDKSDSDGILSKLASLLTGSSADEEEADLGAKMSVDEIKEAASLYGVSVGDYLTGLDNGKYLTLSARKQAESAGGSSASYAPAAFGAAGLAGVGLLASKLFGNKNQTAQQRRPEDDMRNHRPPQGRPDSSRPDGTNQRPLNQSDRPGSGMRPGQGTRPSGDVRSSQRRDSFSGSAPQHGGPGGGPGGRNSQHGGGPGGRRPR